MDHGGRGRPCWTVDLHDVFTISTWLLVVALASGTCKTVCAKDIHGMYNIEQPNHVLWSLGKTVLSTDGML